MSKTKTILSPALKGRLEGNWAGIIAGLIGSIFFREFWLALAKTTTEQVAAMPFWLSIILGVFIGGILGLAIARGIGKHILLLTALGITIGVIIAWNNVIVRILIAFHSSLHGEGEGWYLIVLAFACMLITNVMILVIPGKVLGTLIGVIFKFRGLFIVWGIVSTVLLLSMWKIHTVFSLGIAGNWLSEALVGMFIGMIGTYKAVTNIFNNNRKGGKIDRLFGDEKKVQTKEENEMEAMIISVISLVGGIVGAIFGGLGKLSF